MGYKPLPKQIKDYKSKDQVDKLILATEVQMEGGGEASNFSSALTVLNQKSNSLVDDKFFRGELFPMIANYLPKDMELTEDEKVIIVKGVQTKLTGLTASMPVKCYGDRCPFKASCPLHKIDKAPIGESCHPPGTLIKTAQHGEIPIEHLDCDLHTLITYERRRDAIRGNFKGRQGQSFIRVQRDFIGNMLSITSESKEHKATFDHISISRFNQNALNKFCVYLMRKGDNFRIGKSQLLKEDENGKARLPFKMRMNQEDGDAMWILGVYNTNTQALLAEEYYSCTFQTPKACFSATDDENIKSNGLYKWVTQEELDKHHLLFLKPTCYWHSVLDGMGLSYDHPFIEKDNSNKSFEEVKVYAKHSMMIRACNLLPHVMDIPTSPEKDIIKIVSDIKKYKLVKWEELKSISIEQYQGVVYSLDVDKHKTYFANNIATHNCPIEAMVLDLYTKRYLDEFTVESDNFSEVTTMTMLAATHIMEMRGFMAIGKDDNGESPDGIIKNVVGYTAEEEPITQYQEHPGYAIIERAWRWRTKLLESLGATRKDKMANGDSLKAEFSIGGSSASIKSKIERFSVVDISEG